MTAEWWNGSDWVADRDAANEFIKQADAERVAAKHGGKVVKVGVDSDIPPLHPYVWIVGRPVGA